MFEAALFAMVWALTYGIAIPNVIAMATIAAIAILLFLLRVTMSFSPPTLLYMKDFVIVFKKGAALLMCTRNELWREELRSFSNFLLLDS